MTVGAVSMLALAGVVAARQLLSRKGPVTDDPLLPGRWISPARVIDLSPEGRYWIAGVTTGGGLSLAECGRWRALSGSLQMRATRGGSSDTSVLLPAGLRAGTYRVTQEESLEVELRSAHAPPLRLLLHRDEQPPSPSPEERRALSACN